MLVLFLNHKIQACGIYQYGIRCFENLKYDDTIIYDYKEIDSYEEYTSFVNTKPYNKIIYNYCSETMQWLNNNNIYKPLNKPNLFNIMIDHSYDNTPGDISYFVTWDKNKLSVARPLYNYDPDIFKKQSENEKFQKFIDYGKNDNIPIIGSFGFLFGRKGFDKIIKVVNQQYDYAIIKLLITTAFCKDKPSFISEMNDITACQTKPGIQVVISTDFVENSDVLKFLYSNDINIFLYNTFCGVGNASVIDYALSVRKPLCISNSSMFSHIYSDQIDYEKVSIDYCIKNSVNYLQKFYDIWSRNNFCSIFKKILENNQSQSSQDKFILSCLNKNIAVIV